MCTMMVLMASRWVGIPTVIILRKQKTPSTFLHVLGVIYVKREEMTL